MHMLDSLTEGPPDYILCSHFLQIKRRDFRSLAGNNYLNDKIIDQYLELIRQRNLRKDMMKICPLTMCQFALFISILKIHYKID